MAYLQALLKVPHSAPTQMLHPVSPPADVSGHGGVHDTIVTHDAVNDETNNEAKLVESSAAACSSQVEPH